MWTITLPVVSTRHITPETAKHLTGGTGFAEGLPMANFGKYGTFLPTFEDVELEGLPPDLCEVLTWAKQNGFTDWVRLDADGDTVPGLTLYHWE